MHSASAETLRDEKKVFDGRPSDSFWIALLSLILLCVSLRLALILIYPAVEFADTGGYRLLAQQLTSLNFSGYEGFRTPVYPLILALCGLNWDLVRLVQFLFGISISVMLFILTYWRTSNVIPALLVGASYSLSLNELFFESSILTESSCTFFLVSSLILFARLDLRKSCRTPKNLARLGTIASVTALCRPIFFYLPPLYFGFLVFNVGARSTRSLSRWPLVYFATPPILLLLGWCMINQLALGYFGLDTRTGYALTNLSGTFMELAPAKYSRIRDIYLEFRTSMGTTEDTIWKAEEKMRPDLKLSPVQLSEQLSTMSIEMFAEHPLLYAKAVAKSFVEFWEPAMYRHPQNFRSRFALDVVTRVWEREVILIRAVNLGFLMVSVVMIFEVAMGRETAPIDLCVIAIVLGSALVASMTEYAHNQRYSVPVQPLISYVVVVFLWQQLLRFGFRDQRSAIEQV
jgi:hypothetical protein